jgi:hypothetical protein
LTIKEQLLKEIELAPENLLAEILDYLRFLKTKAIQTQAETHADDANKQTPLKSTGRSLLEIICILATHRWAAIPPINGWRVKSLVNYYVSNIQYSAFWQPPDYRYFRYDIKR